MREGSEQLSAFVDGEYTAEEATVLFAKLQKDVELKQQYDRYQRTGDLMRGESSPSLGVDFAANVSAAIEQEATVLVPTMASATSIDKQQSVLAKILKPVAGFAVAATVASVAILMTQTNTNQITSTPVEIAAVEAPAVPMATPKVASYAPVVNHGTRWDLLQTVAQPVAVENSLNNYLVNHHEYAMSRGRQGMLSYARIAGYDTEER